MSASNPAATASAGAYNAPAFWEFLWRTSGLQFLGLFIIAYIIYGYQPETRAPADTLLAFYDGHRTRVLVAVFFSGLNLLNLLWFTAALRTTLADAGRDGWGAAATASSAAFGALFFLALAISGALAYSIAGSGNEPLTSGLNDFNWSLMVLSSFPRAMLSMSAAFGLWRSRQISNSLFGVGVGALVLQLLGVTTWMRAGFWAPDGGYTRFVSPLIGLLWLLVVSRVLLTRSPATRTGW